MQNNVQMYMHLKNNVFLTENLYETKETENFWSGLIDKNVEDETAWLLQSKTLGILDSSGLSLETEVIAAWGEV